MIHNNIEVHKIEASNIINIYVDVSDQSNFEKVDKFFRLPSRLDFALTQQEMAKTASTTKSSEKPAKKVASSTEKDTKKKSKKRTSDSFSTYIAKVLKKVQGDLQKDNLIEANKKLSMSKKSMSIMNSFLNDVFEKVAFEASNLCKYQKKDTLSAREILNAVKLVFPQDYSHQVIKTATKFVQKAVGEESK